VEQLRLISILKKKCAGREYVIKDVGKMDDSVRVEISKH